MVGEEKLTRYSRLSLACALSKADFQAEVEPILQTIFVAGDDTFSPTPFAPDIPVKRILFNWDYRYIVEPPLLDAVVTAARHVSDVGFFFLPLWRISSDAYPYAWYIPFSANDVYKLSENSPIGEFVFSEQVIVSPNGHWGIMTTHEFVATGV